MNSRFCLVTLNPDECSGYIVGAMLPTTEDAYSPALDIRFNRSLSGWCDSIPHLHMSSEEYYLVLRGQIDLRVNDVLIPVHAGQLIGVRAGMFHQVTGGAPPIENFIIRVPGGGNDKVVMADGRPMTTTVSPILLDLHQPHSDYLLGACLSEDHLNYSPQLDFTCVWNVDPAHEWKNEQLHYHTLREEYYIVLRGRLDFRIGSDVVRVVSGQVIGVKAHTVHKIIGGEGPVDILFVRVPGGRGDKVLVSE